jgi:hypothetical protein
MSVTNKLGDSSEKVIVSKTYDLIVSKRLKKL